MIAALWALALPHPMNPDYLGTRNFANEAKSEAPAALGRKLKPYIATIYPRIGSVWHNPNDYHWPGFTRRRSDADVNSRPHRRRRLNSPPDQLPPRQVHPQRSSSLNELANAPTASPRSPEQIAVSTFLQLIHNPATVSHGPLNSAADSGRNPHRPHQ